MTPGSPLCYPPQPPSRTAAMFVSAAVTVIYACFCVGAVIALVGGIGAGSGGALLFGVFATCILAFLFWQWLHLASRLEFADGQLKWRSSIPWSPAMRPGRMRTISYPVSRTRLVRIELDDGRRVNVLPRPGLMEFIDGVRAAEPAILIDVSPEGLRRMSRRAAGPARQRASALAARRPVQAVFGAIVLFLVLAFAANFGLTLAGSQENFRTLRSELTKVHLPAGYRLTIESRSGTDCKHAQCSITQMWTWSAGGSRGTSAACADVYQAMTAAYSTADANSPMPAGAACDYYALLDSFFHPGAGKPSAECIVRPAPAQPGGVVVDLTASYGT